VAKKVGNSDLKHKPRDLPFKWTLIFDQCDWSHTWVGVDSCLVLERQAVASEIMLVWAVWLAGIGQILFTQNDKVPIKFPEQ